MARLYTKFIAISNLISRWF